MNRLKFRDLKAHELAHLCAGDDIEQDQWIFTRADGIDIPPSTMVRITYVLEHIPPKTKVPQLFEGVEIPVTI